MADKAFYAPMGILPTTFLSPTYFPIGPLPQKFFIGKIVNNSDTDLFLSTDGTTDEDLIPAGETLMYDIRYNKGRDPEFAYPKYPVIFVRGNPGTGNVYLVTLGVSE